MIPFIKALALLSVALVAQADPPMASFSSFNDWIDAEPRGVRVGADGRLRLAPALRRVAQLPEGVVWCVVPDGTGGAFLSAGTEGALFHYTKGQVKPFAKVKGGIVFAMAKVGQDLIVAPSGEGKLFRVTPAGDVKPYADIEARLVWAMTFYNSELFLAGLGEKGALFMTAREGNSRKLAEMPGESAFTVMVPDGQGGWYLGSHGRGLVLRYGGVQAGDRLETLLSTGFEEVRALVLQDDRLYIGVTSGVANRLAGGTLEPRESYTSASGSGAKGAVISLERNGVPTTLWQSSQSQVFSLTAWNGQLLVGTGNRSRIFSIPLAERERSLDPFSVMQDLGTAQVTSFLTLGGEMLVIGSNPSEIHALSDIQATEGTIESRVVKGNPLADWGRSYLDADTPSGTNVELQMRAGATETPDEAWMPWTPPLRSGERPVLKPSRYAQFRLKLTSSRGGASPVVEGVRVHWADRNLAPVWESVDVMPPGLVITRTAPPEDIGIERVPYETQKLIPALVTASGERRSFRRGAQAFLFRVSDPNTDQLAFHVRLLPESGLPMELEKAWKERYFTFDTLPVPDGRYRLEVTASDAPSQPFNQALSSTWRTAPFMIDHTPPVIAELSAMPEDNAIRVRFTARDGMSILKEIAIGAREGWLQVAPADGIFDLKEESVDVLVPKDRLKEGRILVKVVDSCNNEQTASMDIANTAAKKR